MIAHHSDELYTIGVTCMWRSFSYYYRHDEDTEAVYVAFAAHSEFIVLIGFRKLGGHVSAAGSATVKLQYSR